MEGGQSGRIVLEKGGLPELADCLNEGGMPNRAECIRGERDAREWAECSVLEEEEGGVY